MDGATSVAFLKEVFGLERGIPLQGYIRFALIDTSTDKDGWKTPIAVWRSAAELDRASDDASLAEFLGRNPEGLNVYFTPHMFKEVPENRSLSVNKLDAVELGAACWVECDDMDITPSQFSPPPSLVVETSPGRHHMYWLLENPLPLTEVEKLNWRLTYGNNLRKDTGGWHLVKFMRLPGTMSYKRETPNPVRVTSEGWNTSRLYVPESFEILAAYPDGDEHKEFIANLKNQDPPDGEPHEGGVGYYRERYNLSQEMVTLLTEQTHDRSNALWRLYNGGIRSNVPPEDIFYMILGTPNDKFSASWRYNARQGLWTDIQRAVRMQEKMEHSPVRRQILGIMSAKGVPVSEKRHGVAQAVYQDLSAVGRLYFDENMGEALYLNKSAHENGLKTSDAMRVVPIEPSAPQWRILFTNRYGIPRGAPDYAVINELIFTRCGQEGERVTPHLFSHFDIEHQMLYVHAGGRYMYRLDGREVTRLDNGDEEVLFKTKPGSAAYEADLDIAMSPAAYRLLPEGDREGPTLEEALFTIPNFPDNGDGPTPKEQSDLARLWMYCLFFPELMPARPHLVVTGPTSSGKTMFFELMLDLFYGPGQRVMSIPSDKKEFETAVTNHHAVIYDNVDTPNAWFTDAVAEVATGIQYSKRILYTTNSSVQYNAQCFLGMTTRDPWFSRTDVATRLIVLNVERREQTITPLALINRVTRNREHLWGQLLWDLNRIVRYLREEGGMQTFEDTRSSIRMAGFEAMAHAVAGRVVPLNARRMVDIVTGEQSQAALDHSILWEILKQWLDYSIDGEEYPHLDRKVTAQELYPMFRDIATLNGMWTRYERVVSTTRSLGRQLRELIPEIQQQYDVEIHEHRQGVRYTFHKKGYLEQ